MEQMEGQGRKPILKLEDLIPYRNSLKELWEEEAFQPVLRFLSSLYKDSVNEIIYPNMTGDVAGMIAIAEKRAVARLCNTLYNLPDVIQNLEGEFERQTAQKLRFVKAQEKGGTEA